jgi:multidrug efflux pump subunit AcrA (membrane-fusion protein)
MSVFNINIIIGCGLFFLLSCAKNTENTSSQESSTETVTSVTIVSPSDTVNIKNNLALNATSTYLLSSAAKANTTGYITAMTIKPMDRVNRGQNLFTIQTKESRALGNTINRLDASFRFSGTTAIQSPSSGFVQQLNHQVGDYVQDGEILAVISDENSFGFVLNLPYEYNQLIQLGKTLDVHLPDGRKLQGTISKIMPTVTTTMQTEQILVKVAEKNIPENLIATIYLTKKIATGICIPKSAVLTDDAQSEFWVMKLKNNTTAIKTLITKGIENDQWVEVKSGNLKLNDKIITEGNYGLSEVARIKIQKSE